MKSIAVILTMFLLATGPATGAGELDPDRIGWSRVQLRATRFFMSMNADIRVAQYDVDDIRATLDDPGEGKPVRPGETVIDLHYAVEGLGQHSDASLLIDPRAGFAVQRVSTDSGRKHRYRIYRFTDIGAWHRTRWPVQGEESLSPDAWTERTEGLRPYPESVHGAPITEPMALIYIAAASPLDEPGDRTEVLAFARRHVHRITLEVAEPEPVRVDYREITAEGGRTIDAKVEPIRILIRGQPVDDGDDVDEFDLLGLRGDIELLLDPESRLPLRLSGNIRIVGRVKFVIEKAFIR